jgi:phosphatidylserine decarboxylase precursor-related protein
MQGYMTVGLLLALLTSIPLAWKWHLGVGRTSVVIMALALLGDFVVAWIRKTVAFDEWTSAGLVWMLTVGAASLLLAYRFYRDPERTAPGREDAIVSPADGTVIYVHRSRAGVLPVSNKHGRSYTLTELTKTGLHSDDAVVIGIAMSFSDVHVNRAPIEGRVALCRHFPGRFGSLRKPEMVFENERATTVIERDGFQVAVVQIASRLVRQIAVFLREGADVALGQRLGVIRLGSQVDLVLNARDDLRVTTRAGERVRAGESILAVLECKQAVRAARRREGAGQKEGAIVIGEHVRGLALVRSLGRRGIPVWTLEPEGQLMASASRYSRTSFPWPAGEDSQQLDCLFTLAARYQLDGWALFPTTDETTALFARHHAELGRRFRLTVPPWDVLRWAYDKRLTYRLAADIGVDQPRTFFLKSQEELSKLDCSFPVVLKPAFKRQVNRFTRDKAWRADDRQALVARYAEACQLVDPDVVMIQELIPGGGETQFSYAALCDGGRLMASVTARRTRQYPVDFGHSSSFVETVDQPAIEEPATRLLAAMRYTGLAELEFKYDERTGACKLLDINPRVWTWHALCGRAGVDFPYLLWRSIHGERVPEVRGRPGFRWMRMSTDLVAAWSEMVRGRLSIRTYARSLNGPIELAAFALDDPVPALLEGPRTAYAQWKRFFAATEAPVADGPEHPFASLLSGDS